MHDTLFILLAALAGCLLLGSILYRFDLICAAMKEIRRNTRWCMYTLLFRLRCRFRRADWEKRSTLSLAVSLAMVFFLTITVPGNNVAEPCDPSCDMHCAVHETDSAIYEGLRVAFSVFEGDSADFRNYLTVGSQAAKNILCALVLQTFAWILPVLVPLSAIGATLTLLWNYLPHHVPILSRNWHIFSGLDPYSIRMAKSLHEELQKTKDTGVFIFLRTRRGKASQEDLEEIQKLNYFLYPGDEARFLHWKSRRSRTLRFYFLTENTDENFERMQEFLDAVTAGELFQSTQNPADGFQQELYLLSETESAPMLIDHLRKKLCAGHDRLPVFQNTELYLLDRFRATSYALLRDVPLHRHRLNGELRVLVLGFGKIGREFFRAACSLGVFHDCKTEFTLCDQQIGAKLNMFLSQCPELRRSVTIHPRKLNIDTDALDKLVAATDYHYIVVALGDDERNIRVTSRLKRFYRLRHWEHEAGSRPADVQPQICVNIEDSIKQDYIKSIQNDDEHWGQRFHVFGGLDQVFKPTVLTPRELWNAAQYVHRSLGSIPREAPLNWNEYERRSSIACAVRAEYLCDIVLGDDKQTPYKSRLDDFDRSMLADTEHLRWMAYVRSEGLRYADRSLADVYYNQTHGKHVDILGKLTPCLTNNLAELDDTWNHLSTGIHASDYTGKLSFRQRDVRLVEFSGEIARRANPSK